MKILAIDTSCDETSVAVTEGRHILSNTISSQVDEHAEFGGVVPFLAQRLHRERIDAVIALSLREAGCSLDEVDAIAVTYGPGLAPALEVGIEKAKELSAQLQKPLYGINHMAGHIASCFSEQSYPQYPLLSVLLSGGHSELIYMQDWHTRSMLGATLDDALGEAYDKVAKLLGLGYPGGKVLAERALRGNEHAYDLPIPMLRSGDVNLSYSGLKNAVRLLVSSLGGAEAMTDTQINDVAASFECVAQASVLKKIEKVLEQYPEIRQIAFGGGVAANTVLRAKLHTLATRFEIAVLVPASFTLCTDNAAMIGIAAALEIESGLQPVATADLERVPGLVLN